MNTLTPFSSVLVANRGEIALRIMKTLRSEGLRSNAVYTDADRGSPHVAYADQSILIGSGPVAESYLSIEKIIDAASQCGAKAIHPGYGFLSEREDFSEACEKAGLVFIGPSAQSIKLMGNKALAKKEMNAAGVPCVPGYEGDDQSAATLLNEAKKIGFPLMIKAVAGGGGRGMRLVENANAFDEALKLAQSEALQAFGSDHVILEKAIQRPRHVEVQILADRYGKVLHLGERDCSVQRRHQKIIEETPCPVLSQEQRSEMGRVAVEAARSISYEGAGTVEFLLGESGDFYFLEMNTRLQVEHPVTEMVTGLDLVSLQLSIARGEPLKIDQENVQFSGHALEVRLYAEDTKSGFLPSTGTIEKLGWPQGEGIRIDSGVVEGQAVSSFYDPMLAKIIMHEVDRPSAVKKLTMALENTTLFGPETNRDFLLSALRQDTFLQGDATTAFLEESFGEEGYFPCAANNEDVALAAVVLHNRKMNEAQERTVASSRNLLGWGSPGFLLSRYELTVEGEKKVVQIKTKRDGSMEVMLNEVCIIAEMKADDIFLDDRRSELRGHFVDDRSVWISTDKNVHCFKFAEIYLGGFASNEGVLAAPMHGTITAVEVNVGDIVTAQSRLVVMEAMKMQHELLSPVCGTVSGIYFGVGNQVSAGKVLIEIEQGDAE